MKPSSTSKDDENNNDVENAIKIITKRASLGLQRKKGEKKGEKRSKKKTKKWKGARKKGRLASGRN